MVKNPDAMNLDWNIDAERAKLTAAIVGAHHDPTEKRFTKFDEQQLRKSLAYKSTSEVREKLDDVTRRQALSKRPLAELKEMVRQHHPQPEAFPGWPALPDKMYDSATRSWLVVDREYLETLIKHDHFSFRRLVKLYGAAQIDHRRGLQ
jgi:hypothetical protein